MDLSLKDGPKQIDMELWTKHCPKHCLKAVRETGQCCQQKHFQKPCPEQTEVAKKPREWIRSSILQVKLIARDCDLFCFTCFLGTTDNALYVFGLVKLYIVCLRESLSRYMHRKQTGRGIYCSDQINTNGMVHVRSIMHSAASGQACNTFQCIWLMQLCSKPYFKNTAHG